MSNIRKIWYLHKLMKQQWLRTSELEEIQRKMLRWMIKHAYETVPLYHHKFKSAGMRPEDVKSVKDLSKLPFTTKQEIRDNFPDKVLARGVKLSGCVTGRTTGSSGMPLTVACSIRDDDYEKALALRPNLSCGQKPWSKWAIITQPEHIKPKKWFQHFRFFAPKYIPLWLDTKEQLAILEKFNPEVIDGRAYTLKLLAKEVKETGNDKIHPKLIFSTAELLDNATRSYIESVFGAKVYDQFGCAEVNRTAWECPERIGYHIDIDGVVMEFLSNGEHVAPGERGEIVYTGLWTHAMPFIRYRIGDVGIPSDEKCPCGRGLPLMKVAEGRKDEFVQTLGGKLFPPITWTVIMRDIPGIVEYQIIQEKIDEIRVKIVKGNSFSQETINRVESKTKNVLREDVYIQVELVDEIIRDKLDKRRSVISKVKNDWG